MRKQLRDAKPRKAMPKHTMATTTPLVAMIFDTMFSGQIDEADKMGGSKKTRCGSCEFCLLPDCKVCRACKDMDKYGGTGKLKQACYQRK